MVTSAAKMWTTETVYINLVYPVLTKSSQCWLPEYLSESRPSSFIMTLSSNVVYADTVEKVYII